MTEPYGTSIGIRCNTPEGVALIRHWLAPIWPSRVDGDPVVAQLYSLRVGAASERRGTRNFHLLYFGSQRLARSVDLDEVLAVLRDHLLEAIGYFSEKYVFIEAGVVEYNGAASLILGERGSGVSSLVQELVQQGATYYSDRFAVLDASGDVVPFPRSPNWTDSSMKAPKAVPVSMAWVTRFDKSLTKSQFELQSGGIAVLRIFQHCLTSTTQTKRDLEMVSGIVGRSRVFSGSRAAAPEAAAKMLLAMSGSNLEP